MSKRQSTARHCARRGHAPVRYARSGDEPGSAQRSSRRPKRHTASATAQVATKRRDDDVADRVEVDAGHPVPEAAAQAELLGRDREQLDGADDERDRHRERGDGEVVIDLAHGLGEGPAVGEVHERAVDRVEQRHAGGEEHRQAEDRVPRQPGAGRARGQEEQRDLGRRVEAQAEEDAQRVHLPRLADRAREAPEEAVHEPARLQQVLELVLGRRPRGACRGRRARCPTRTTRLSAAIT